VKSKCWWDLFRYHVRPKTRILGITRKVTCSKYSSNIVHRYCIIPEVIVHVSYPQKRSLVTIRALSIAIETETILRQDSLELKSACEYVVGGPVIVCLI